MSVSVDISFSLKEIEDYEMIPAETRVRAFELVADDYLRMQREMISSGLDANGRAFEMYKEPYRTNKARAGRKVDKPDLTLSGDLLRSQVNTVTRDGNRMTVHFAGQHAAYGFRASKQKKGARGGPMTLSRRNGGGSQNAAVAEGVDMDRKFIGVSNATLIDLFAFYVSLLGVDEKTQKRWRSRFTKRFGK
jgi:hypothetical protein